MFRAACITCNPCAFDVANRVCCLSPFFIQICISFHLFVHRVHCHRLSYHRVSHTCAFARLGPSFIKKKQKYGTEKFTFLFYLLLLKNPTPFTFETAPPASSLPTLLSRHISFLCRRAGWESAGSCRFALSERDEDGRTPLLS